jgi:histidinol-phosphate aminotransferase
LSRFWSERVRQSDPYIPGEQPKNQANIIKLNTNENPYPPSPKVLEAIRQATDDKLRLYPSPTVDELRRTIADKYNLNKEQIFIGNGSDEVLAFSFMAFFNPEERILFPDVTYSFYPVYAKLFDISYKLVSVNNDFTIPIEKFFNAEGGVIFPNPNAPTGIALSLNQIEKILQHNPNKVVIIDEAYVDFGAESACKLIDQYDNLLVIQTLSKSRSLAGIRVGFALGNEQLIEGLNRIKNSINSYTIDRLAFAGAKAAFEDEDYFQETIKKIVDTREQTVLELTKLGFQVIHSQSNFVFASHPEMDAESLYLKLKDKNILIRYFNKPKIDQYVRITIGLPKEMEMLLQNLKELVPRS